MALEHTKQTAYVGTHAQHDHSTRRYSEKRNNGPDILQPAAKDTGGTTRSARTATGPMWSAVASVQRLS